MPHPVIEEPSAGQAAPRVLQDVDLGVERGGIGSMSGPSGSGQGSLLRVPTGLPRPAEGSVATAGTPVYHEDAVTARRVRACFAFAFKQYFPQEMTVLRAVAIAPIIVRRRRAVEVRPRRGRRSPNRHCRIEPTPILASSRVGDSGASPSPAPWRRHGPRSCSSTKLRPRSAQDRWPRSWTLTARSPATACVAGSQPRHGVRARGSEQGRLHGWRAAHRGGPADAVLGRAASDPPNSPAESCGADRERQTGAPQ